MNPRFFFTLLPCVTLIQACSISRPCSEAGDVSWNPPIVGDKRCAQKKLPNGLYVNEGPFRQIYQKTGKLALEGHFSQGQKEGIWLYYGEDQKLKAAKFFEKGVEKTPPSETQKEIDRIIQQKSGTK